MIKMYERYKAMIRGALWGLALCALMAMCSGCKSYEPAVVERVRTDTLYESKIIHDSIYRHDSTTLYIRGDTVYRDRLSTMHVYHYDVDTVLKIKRDSIPYAVYVDREVKTVSPFTWFLLAISIVCFLVAVMIVKIKAATGK